MIPVAMAQSSDGSALHYVLLFLVGDIILCFHKWAQIKDDTLQFAGRWHQSDMGQHQILPPHPTISLLPPGLPSRTIAWTFFSELLRFSFYFPYFVFVLCARLSCPSRQLLSVH